MWQRRLIAWLDRYVKNFDAHTGPRIEWQAQDGYYYGAPRYPLPNTQWVTGESVTTGAIGGPGPGGGDGPADGNPAPEHELGTSAARAEILGPTERPRPILGRVELNVTGALTGVGGFVLFELIDVAPDGKLVTLDDQVMPVRLDSGTVDRTVALHGVSWILKPGHSLELEVTTGSASYALSRTGPYSVDLTIEPRIPVAPPKFAAPARRAD